MSTAARRGKFNKTKRGGGRTFSRVERGQDDGFWGEPADKNGSSSSGEESSDEEAPQTSATRSAAPKLGPIQGPGEEVLVETQNPNRVAQRNLKLSDLKISDSGPSGTPGGGMSRKEREEAEAKRKKEAWMKATMEGKTDQAKADLARLAIIRKQREDAARKRQVEVDAKSKPSGAKGDSLTAGKALITKSLGK